MANPSSHSARLLLAVSHPFPDDAQYRVVRELANGVTDWTALLAAAERCRATPILHARLYGAGVTQLPEDILARLRTRHRANAARTTYLTAELGAILGTLAAANVAALVLKGPVLARQAYDDPTVRQFDDLDLLVRRRDFARARTAISGMGYDKVLPLPESVDRSPFRPDVPATFRRPDGDYDVDLACRVAHDYFSLRINPDLPWETAESVALDGVTVQTPGHSLMLVLLCAHGAKHLWSRPGWIADVAGLVQGGTTNWAATKAIAQRAGATRLLRLGLALAKRVYGTELPASLSHGIAADARVMTLCDRALSTLEEAPGRTVSDDLDRARYHLESRERLRDRLRYCTVRGLCPSHNDWRALSMPGALYPLYYLLRPLRLCFRRSPS